MPSNDHRSSDAPLDPAPLASPLLKRCVVSGTGASVACVSASPLVVGSPALPVAGVGLVARRLGSQLQYTQRGRHVLALAYSSATASAACAKQKRMSTRMSRGMCAASIPSTSRNTCDLTGMGTMPGASTITTVFSSSLVSRASKPYRKKESDCIVCSVAPTSRRLTRAPFISSSSNIRMVAARLAAPSESKRTLIAAHRSPLAMLTSTHALTNVPKRAISGRRPIIG
mmetsp:Transcript_2422/g.6295  ORF Transcript_2422/g.6295 Transcript_2422/m.6295 type:complete len:228 (-) Transcript_2422:3287-3970(-)